MFKMESIVRRENLKEVKEEFEIEKTSSGCDAIDTLLNGGYENDVITTIYGPAGSGKTNLCLAAMLSVTKKKKAIFIDTEGGFSVTRLKQLCNNSKAVLERVFFLSPTDFEEQKRIFERLKDYIDENIGMIIVDTISMLYRAERGDEKTDSDIKEINRALGKQLNYLGEITRKKRIPVLVTNQVYSDFSDRNVVKMVGGDILRYASKCLIELQLSNKRRKAILRKHRSLPEGTEVFFEIRSNGIFMIQPKAAKSRSFKLF